ncbi:MAG: hypothetical protein O3A00_18885 [Planctomycetota bacterium]|nr:hypothetical protein [Planctomycetota bacterium]
MRPAVEDQRFKIARDTPWQSRSQGAEFAKPSLQILPVGVVESPRQVRNLDAENLHEQFLQANYLFPDDETFEAPIREAHSRRVQLTSFEDAQAD